MNSLALYLAMRRAEQERKAVEAAYHAALLAESIRLAQARSIAR